VALGIAGHVVSGDFEARQFVFSKNHVELTPLRPRLQHEIRILGARPSDRGKPLRELRRIRIRNPARAPHLDQRRA